MSAEAGFCQFAPVSLEHITDNIIQHFYPLKLGDCSSKWQPTEKGKTHRAGAQAETGMFTSILPRHPGRSPSVLQRRKSHLKATQIRATLPARYQPPLPSQAYSRADGPKHTGPSGLAEHGQLCNDKRHNPHQPRHHALWRLHNSKSEHFSTVPTKASMRHSFSLISLDTSSVSTQEFTQAVYKGHISQTRSSGWQHRTCITNKPTTSTQHIHSGPDFWEEGIKNHSGVLSVHVKIICTAQETHCAPPTCY